MNVFGWNIRLVDIASLSIAVFISIGVIQFFDYRKQAEPIDNWLEIKRISVPDFSLDEDPPVLLDLDVKRPFFAQRNVVLRDIDVKSDETNCTARTRRAYEPSDDQSIDGIPLSDIIGGRRCQISSGQHVLEFTWEIQRDGYAPRLVTQVSNIFNILPPGAQQYITPEQVEKLK
jgi:hypothetical protein